MKLGKKNILTPPPPPKSKGKLILHNNQQTMIVVESYTKSIFFQKESKEKNDGHVRRTHPQNKNANNILKWTKRDKDDVKLWKI